MLSYAGSPDLTYGTGGFSPIPASLLASEGVVDQIARASALQSNGDLVVVGVASSYRDGLYPVAAGFLALRYDSNGTVDSSFDSTDLFNTAGLQTDLSNYYSGATGVAVLANGNLIVVGNASGSTATSSPTSAKVLMLNPDGTLDTSFGTGGVVTLGTVGTTDGLLDYAGAVAILPGGQIAVGGTIAPSSGHELPAVEVLNADGSVDTSYGTNGVASVPVPANAAAYNAIAFGDGAAPLSMVVQPDGKAIIDANAVIASTSTVEVVSSRLTAAGTLDTTYGTGGQATITPQSVFPSATVASGTALALDANGDPIIGGAVFIPGLPFFRAFAVRLTTAGALDTTFGVGGVNILPPVSIYGSTVGAIAIQSDGKIVLADQTSADFTRLDADGSLDPTFGNSGQSFIYDSTQTLREGDSLGDVAQPGTVALAITSDGKILATEAPITVSPTSGVRQLLAQGAVNDFDGDGISDPAVYTTSTGDFTFIPSTGGAGPTIHFGPTGLGATLPAPGAYGGEGIDELGIYIPSVAEFAILSFQTGQIVTTPFGVAGDPTLPAPGDYDRSGADELAIYDPATDIYAYHPAAGGPSVYVQIGSPGQGGVPVPGDYFGTGQDDVAIYETVSKTYLIQDPTTGQIVSIPFGVPGPSNSIPVPGDYDGSGKTELAVYVPSLAELIYAPADGAPSVAIPFGLSGIGATLPLPGDYDGSGKTEVAAYFPSSSLFAYHPADGGNDVFDRIGLGIETIPFTLNAAPSLGTSEPQSVSEAAVDVPLTPDVLDALNGTAAKKKTEQA